MAAKWFNSLDTNSRDWPSFLLFAGALCEHSIVSPLLQTRNKYNRALQMLIFMVMVMKKVCKKSKNRLDEFYKREYFFQILLIFQKDFEPIVWILSIEENVEHTWMEASIRSRGFWIHSSHRFSLEPVLEVAAELASEVAEDWAAKLEIAPKGPEK